MLIELVLRMSLYPFSSLFSKLGGYSDKLGTRPSIVLCLARLCKDVKLEVRIGMCLFCQRCGGIIGSNVIAFIKSGVENVQANLFAIEDVVNVELTEDLLCFVYDNEE